MTSQIGQSSKKGSTRVSRAESQVQTRQALLDAARAVLVEQGVTAASVELIAERAGYSKGAVYSNFASKEAILLELMRLHMSDEVAALQQILVNTSTLNDLLNRLRDLYGAMHAQPAVVVLSIEFQLLAMRSRSALDQYEELWRAHRSRLAELLEAAAVRLGCRLRSPAVDVIDALAALTHGLVLQAAVGRPKSATPVEELMLKALRDELVVDA